MGARSGLIRASPFTCWFGQWNTQATLRLPNLRHSCSGIPILYSKMHLQCTVSVIVSTVNEAFNKLLLKFVATSNSFNVPLTITSQQTLCPLEDSRTARKSAVDCERSGFCYIKFSK